MNSTEKTRNANQTFSTFPQGRVEGQAKVDSGVELMARHCDIVCPKKLIGPLGIGLLTMFLRGMCHQSPKIVPGNIAKSVNVHYTFTLLIEKT